MLNIETVTLENGRTLKIMEVSPRKVLALLPFLGGGDAGGKEKSGDDAVVEKTFRENTDELLRLTCDLSLDDFLDLHPSEMERVWSAFRGVNAFFFTILEKMGIMEQVETIARSLLDGVTTELATSLQEDIRGALTTASPGLSGPPDDLKKPGVGQ